MLSFRLIATPLGASLFVVLAACGGAEPPAGTTRSPSPTDAGAMDAADVADVADAAGWSLGIVATDTLAIDVTGGLPAGCPGKGPHTAAVFYRLDLAAGTLNVSRVAACPDDAGAEPSPVDVDVTLAAADRDAVVFLAEALTGELVTRYGCVNDAPDERLQIIHRDQSEARWPVRQGLCINGIPHVRYEEYGVLRAKLDELSNRALSFAKR